MTAQTYNSFLYEEPLVPCTHFCKDPMVIPSMSVASSTFLPKATELAQILGLYLAEFSKEMKSQHLSQNTLVSKIATACNYCALECVNHLQTVIRQNIQHRSHDPVITLVQKQWYAEVSKSLATGTSVVSLTSQGIYWRANVFLIPNSQCS